MTVTNVSPPVVSGTAQQGQTLSTSNGVWTSDDPLVYGYEWLRCDAAGSNCVVITNQVANSLLLGAADVGSRIRSRVTATEVASGELAWAPPTAGQGGVAVVNFTLTNATRSSSTLGSGAGRDLIIDQTEVLTGGMAQMTGWRHVIWIGGEFNVGGSTDTTCIIPRDCTGIVHLEGIYIRGSGVSDAIVVRLGGSGQIIQIQNCNITVNYKGVEHADCFQSQQGRISELRMDKNTLKTNYQGIFLRNSNSSSFINSTDLRRVNFRRNAADPSTFLWITDEDPTTGDIPIGPVSVTDVWMETTSDPGMDIYPNRLFQDFKVSGNFANKEGNFVETDGQGTYIRPSTTSDVVPPGGTLSGQQCESAGWSGGIGKIRVGTPPAANDGSTDGINYVSPGYV